MGVYEAVKDAAALAQKAGNMDLYRELLDAMKTTLDQHRTIQMLEARNAELEDALTFKNKLKLRDNCLWNEADDDDTVPYCSRCFEVEGKAIHLHDHDWTWACPACQGGVRKPGRTVPIA